MDSQLLLGQALAVIIAVCWSQNSVIYTILGKSFDTDCVAHVRLWIAVPCLFLVTRIFSGRFFPLNLRPATYGLLLLSGVIGFFITDVLMYRSYTFIGPREGQSVQTLSPCFSAILAFFFVGETLSLSQLGGMAVTIIGLLIMFYPDLLEGRKMNVSQKHDRKKGILLAFFAAGFQALSLVIVKMVNEEIDPYSTNLLRSIGGLVSIALYRSLVKHSFRKDFKILRQRKSALMLISAAVLGPVTGMCLEMKAFTLAPVGVVTSITQISPILLLPSDHFLIGKKIPFLSILGTFISIAGVVLLFVL